MKYQKLISRKKWEMCLKIKNLLAIQLYFLHVFESELSEFFINGEQYTGGNLPNVLLVGFTTTDIYFIGNFYKEHTINFLTYV